MMCKHDAYLQIAYHQVWINIRMFQVCIIFCCIQRKTLPMFCVRLRAESGKGGPCHLKKESCAPVSSVLNWGFSIKPFHMQSNEIFKVVRMYSAAGFSLL
jgi:hypothetical protein